MSGYFKKIALAIGFSPTSKALLKEASRLAYLFKAQLILVHVGAHGSEEESKMNELIQSVDAADLKPIVLWKEGDPVKEILKICSTESIDLLVAGALKKENLLQNYIGTVARKIMRKANCSILMIQNPNQQRGSVNTIVVNAEDSPYIEDAIRAGCYLGKMENVQWVHIVRELKLLGLALSANEQCTEDKYNESMQGMMREEIDEVQKILTHIPHENLKVNIKMLSGKSGYELARFAERKKAELLIVGAPARRLSLFDRVFPHDLEYIFANLPCNLLVINPRTT
ncbi:MAG: universal stress protein [Cyclobacteriaceae bacterium]|nr:universal stress protein [Cyclobacteriaceae bacterium]